MTGCGSVWLERYLREVEAASSNLVTPIREKKSIMSTSFFRAIENTFLENKIATHKFTENLLKRLAFLRKK